MDDDALGEGWLTGITPPTHVYVAVAAGFVKIGATHDISRRLDELARPSAGGCKHPVAVEGIRPSLVTAFKTNDGLHLERALLDAFSEEREIGEWLHVSDRLDKWLSRRTGTPWMDEATWTAKEGR